MNPFLVATHVIEKLRHAGGVAYIAGGAVRDLLMGKTPYDIDIATSLSVDEIRPLFAKTIEVGVQFGILIVVEQGIQFEIATFRTDSDYLDGRRPTKISQSTPEEDASRRDFTINGMFFDPINEETIDFVGGKADIEAKTIRAIGNPHDRFREDRLRMIRAIRYASRFQFAIDPTTQEAIREHAHTLLPAVSFERILQEMQKMDVDGTFFHGFIEMHRLGLLNSIFPNLETLDTDFFVSVRAPQEAPLILQLKSLLQSYTKEQRQLYLERLKFPQKELELLRFSEELPQILREGSLQNRVHAYASPHFGSAQLLLPTELSNRANDEKQIYQHAIQRIQQKKPIVTASDLLELGIEKGPEMGVYLRKAEEIALTHQLTSKEEILKRLFP